MQNYLLTLSSRPKGNSKLKINWKFQCGFTLVELILVMAIIAVLTTFITGGIGSSQVKGRDAQRKSDLKQISQTLELYYQD